MRPRCIYLLSLLSLLLASGCLEYQEDNGSSNNGANNGSQNNGDANNGATNNGDTNNGQVELAACQDNVDCRGGEICRGGLCREACAQDDPCRGPLGTCDLAQGYCVGCVADSDCGANQACGGDQQCTFFCRSDAACGDGQYCDDQGQCQEAECAMDADCPGGFRCASGLCVSIDSLACEPGEQRCQGNQAVRCSRDGTMESSEDCGALLCQESQGAALCVDPDANNGNNGNNGNNLPGDFCSPGSPGCDGDLAVICNPQGTGWVPARTNCADSGQVCQLGACVTVEEGCPLATAQGRVQGSPSWSNQVLAAVGDTVELDATESVNADSFSWSLLERPTGSSARLVPSATSPTPSLRLDQPGRYVVELEAFDANGGESCDQPRVTIFANETSAGLRLSLIWETPEDTNPTDMTGADMDVHLLHPRGRWNAAPWDCYWQNPSPDWGEAGELDDNPSLDIDDSNGEGPENISFAQPEERTYSVGVHYFNDQGYGSSTATLRVYINDVLRQSWSQELTARDQFWDVARIDWDSSPSLRSVNRVTNGFPAVTPTPDCVRDSDCGANEVCAAGACVNPSTCQENADCGPGQVCNGGSCTSSPLNCNDSQEPNNVTADAAILAPGTYTGLSLCEGDEDWYQVNTLVGLTVDVTYTPTDAPVVLVLEDGGFNPQTTYRGSNGALNALALLSLNGSFRYRIYVEDDTNVQYTMEIINVAP